MYRFISFSHLWKVEVGGVRCVAGSMIHSKSLFSSSKLPYQGSNRPTHGPGKGQGHLDGGGVFKISPAFRKWRQCDGTLAKKKKKASLLC